MGNDIVGDVTTDTEGFLTEPAQWSDEVAFELASRAGIAHLTADHWAVIRQLRNDYHAGEPDRFPQVRAICSQLQLPDDCVSRLFGDPAVAWRIAGLPKPATDLSAFMPSSELT